MTRADAQPLVGRTDLDLARHGDEAAFARLVATYHADLARVAYVVTGDRSLAEDAAQSAWFRAWTRLSSLREPERLRGWLLAIVVNEARQVVRRSRRVHIAELDFDIAGATSADPAVGISRLDLVRVLAGLSADDRALLALRYVAGLDATELGELTGRSASGTRTRLTRLKARLRQELGDD